MRIKLDQVSYTYPGKYRKVTAVNGVSREFRTGTMYAIVGASGSGKSTLLSLLAGLKIPTSGKVCYDEVSTGEMDRSCLRREKVSVIYQDFNLFPLLTVEENVLYPMKLQKKSKEEAEKTCREKLLSVGLTEDLFRALPRTLSGGQQQRVAIARALAAGSPVILADEPTGALDSKNSENIVSLLKDLAHSGDRCVIVVTHDPKVAEQADIVLNMRDGALESPETPG